MYLSKGFWFTVVPIIVLSVLFQFLQEIDISLAYHRSTFWDCIFYQAITPNLIHLNWIHWLLNISNLMALIFIFDRAWNYITFILLFLTSSIFIILLLYFYSPNVVSYVGMSGVIYSLAVYGSLYNFHQQKLLSLAILFFVILKLSANESVNHLLGVDSILGGITIITDAHLYGAIVGFAFFVVQSVIITLYFYDKKGVHYKKNNQRRLSTQSKSCEITEEKL